MSHGSVSRRRFLYLSGALGGALAAGGPFLAHDLESAAASGLDAQPVTIYWWAPNGGGCSTYVKIGKAYQHLHPNVQIQNKCGTGTQDYLTALLATIAAGNPPDAAWLWDPPVSLAARGALLPLDQYMANSPSAQKKAWPPAALASCQWKGKTYGFPLTDSAMGMWYNVDWFAKKGIPTSRDKFPTTWDELRKLSKEFTHWKGDRLMTAGYIPLNDVDWPVMLFVWSALNGGQLYDGEKRKYTIDADPNVALMEYMVSWLNEEYKGDLGAVESSGNWGNWSASNTTHLPNAFEDSRLAINEWGSWMLEYQYLSATPKYKRFNVAQFPVGPGGTKTVSGVWPNWVAIPMGTHHPQEAFGWIDYLASTGMLSWWHAYFDFPANKTLPRTLTPPPITTKKHGLAFARDMMNFFYQQADISIPVWNSPVQHFAQDQLQRAVERIMRKAVTPKQGLAEAQQACQGALMKVQ